MDSLRSWDANEVVPCSQGKGIKLKSRGNRTGLSSVNTTAKVQPVLKKYFFYYTPPAHVSTGTAIIRRVRSVLRNVIVVLPDTVIVPFQNAVCALLCFLN
jgi:hypothetical protein